MSCQWQRSSAHSGQEEELSSQTDGSNPSPLLLFVWFGQITPLLCASVFSPINSLPTS
jgi:hypothetical protein